jgi:DnaK suppressor protein
MKRDKMVLLVIEEFEKERAQILQELLELREALKAEVDADVDEGDPKLVQHDRIISLIQEHERQLKLLDRALQQARQGSHGICERCHEPIDPAYLEAIPDTTLCVKYKPIIEKEQGTLRTPLI